ncbi:hypothetical protein Ancab_004276 [Ancistrocladus abbreviatus]
MERVKQWLASHDHCPRCHPGTELIFHVFHDCGYARSVWISMLAEHHSDFFSINSLTDWIMTNIIAGSSGRQGRAGRFYLGGLGWPRKEDVHITWHQSYGSWIKVNTDGLVIVRERVGAGGLILGTVGEWLGGFAIGLEPCTIPTVKLWGILVGLKLAQNSCIVMLFCGGLLVP